MEYNLHNVSLRINGIYETDKTIKIIGLHKDSKTQNTTSILGTIFKSKKDGTDSMAYKMFKSKKIEKGDLLLTKGDKFNEYPTKSGGTQKQFTIKHIVGIVESRFKKKEEETWKVDL